MKKLLIIVSVYCTIICFALLNSCLGEEHDRIKAALSPFAESGEMPGFVTIIADAESILQVDAIGYADVETKSPMQEDTLFWIASTSKPFTAATLMLLVDEGKVSLDDPVAKHLPEFENLKLVVKNEDGSIEWKKPKNAPTVRQVLSHTSGWPFLSPYHQKYGIDSLSPEKSATIYSLVPLENEPGTSYKYSNLGINIATSIIEKITGKPLAEVMKTRLFDPLEMPTTSFIPSEKQVEKLAKSYKWNKQKNQLEETKIGFFNYPLFDSTIRFSEGGGGLFSTAPEVTHFFQMLAANGMYKGKRILSEEAVREMRTKQTGNLPQNYGLALNVEENHFGHGGAFGNDAFVTKKGDKSYVVIYMVQVTEVPKQQAAKETFIKAVNQILN
ncbi:MAG: serine hydrolase domain-containing protein [Thermoguttaceae bacterium]